MSTAPFRAALAAVCLASSAAAQDAVVTLPPSITLPNYSRVPIGPLSEFEASAYVARADDTSANWHNPAGLSRVERFSLSATATLWEIRNVELTGLESQKSTTGGAIPSFLGFVLPLPIGGGRLWGGFSVTVPVSWNEVIDTDLSVQRGAGREALVYSANVAFSQLVPAVALAWAPKGSWRFGLGASLTATTFDSNLTLSDRIEGGDAPRSSLLSARGNGSVAHVRLQLGAQYDLSSSLRFGAVVRTPGLRLNRSGSLTLDAVSADAQGRVDIAFRDTDARFDYKLPCEVDLGAAFLFGRGAVELDLRAFDGAGSYDVFASDHTFVITSATGSEATHTETAPFTNSRYRARRLVDVALGGRYQVGVGKTVHAGFFTSFSPVSEGGTFQKVDLYGLTLGGSKPGEHYSSSFGITYVFGTSGPYVVGDLAGGGQATSRLKVRTFGFTYSGSFRF